MKIVQIRKPVTFKFTCPRCQQGYEGPWSMHRQDFDCQNCGQHFKTPRKPIHWVFITVLVIIAFFAWSQWRGIVDLNAFLDSVK